MIQPRQVELTLSPSDASKFTGLLQQGVVLPAATDCSLWSFLVDQIGIDSEYVKERITTIFLDGDVVDSLEKAILRDGSVLALSAAMPGLAGATLRRGGFYAAMRSTITHKDDPAAASSGAAAGAVRVKLFNLLIPELGPALLARGVVLDPPDATGIVPALDAAAKASSGPMLLRVRFAAEREAPGEAR